MTDSDTSDRALRGGQRGTQNDPCPRCGRPYDRFHPPGVSIVREADPHKYHRLQEAVREYAPGTYIHDHAGGDTADDRATADAITVLQTVWLLSIVLATVTIIGGIL